LVRLHRDSELNLGDDIRALVHVTDGGLLSRLTHFCKVSKVGGTIESGIEPPPEMNEIRELGEVDLVEAYRTWNQGIGMLVVTSDACATSVVEHLIRDGHRAEIVGRVVDPPHLTVRLQGGIVYREAMAHD
jgi:phosphoribosylformylglycinamidine cyclo-ligase